jgi:hypothetical protein
LLLSIIITGADANLYEHATIAEVSTCVTQRHHVLSMRPMSQQSYLVRQRDQCW